MMENFTTYMSTISPRFSIIVLAIYSFIDVYGGGNGNLLQCSCLDNPRNGEAWWAAVYGVTQSQTRLK